MTPCSIPTIAIGIPAYNIRQYIGSCLDSVLRQTDIPDEIIVVDDGSTDSTGDILDEYQHRYPEIKVYHEKNRGLCGARNFALSVTTSDYILFLDGDDILAPDAVRYLRCAAYQHRPDVIQGKRLVFEGKKRWIPESYKKVCTHERFVDIMQCPELFNTVSVAAKLLSVSFLREKKVHFLDGVMMTEDHYFSNQCYSKAEKILVIPSEIYFHRTDNLGSSINTAKLSYFSDISQVVKSSAGLFPDDVLQRYHRRFLDYDFFAFGIDKIFFLPPSERAEAFSYLTGILEFFPDTVKNNLYGKLRRRICGFIEEKQYGKALLLIYYRKNCYSTVQRTITRMNIWTKPIRKQLWKAFCSRRQFFYSLFSLLPMKKTTVAFGVRPRSGLVFFQPLYDLACESNVVNTVMVKASLTYLSELKAMYQLARSKVILLDNHYGILFGVKPRKGQSIIQIWHAAGIFKRFGMDMFDSSKKARLEAQKREHSSYTHFVTSSPVCNDAYASAFGMDPSRALPLGAVKTDRLFTLKDDMPVLKEELIRKYPKLQGKKLVLYAPTFRDTERRYTKKNPMTERQLAISPARFQEELRDGYVLGLRFHDLLSFTLNGEYSSVINVTDEDEQTLLACTDVLITDYSSIIFDFSFFQRPIVFYAYDLVDYAKERGFYHRYASFVPGPICRTEDELFETLGKRDFSNDSMAMKRFWNTYMSACDGKSSAKILAHVEDIVGK